MLSSRTETRTDNPCCKWLMQGTLYIALALFFAAPSGHTAVHRLLGVFHRGYLT